MLVHFLLLNFLILDFSPFHALRLNFLLLNVVLFDFFIIILFKAHRHTIKHVRLESRVLVIINIPQHAFVDSIGISLYVGLYIQKLLLDEILLYDFNFFIIISFLKHIVTLQKNSF